MDERVASVIAKVEAFIADKDDALAIPRQAGEFIHALLLAAGTKNAVEVGTSYGYSGLWIASAVQANGGRLTTIDRDQRKSDTAAVHFADAGLSDCICLETGVATDVVGRLTGDYDFAFLDADKENCIRYTELLLPRLRRGAMVLTDNTLTHAEQLAGFVRWIRTCGEFFSTHIPGEHGMELAVKL